MFVQWQIIQDLKTEMVLYGFKMLLIYWIRLESIYPKLRYVLYLDFYNDSNIKIFIEYIFPVWNGSKYFLTKCTVYFKRKNTQFPNLNISIKNTECYLYASMLLVFRIAADIWLMLAVDVDWRWRIWVWVCRRRHTWTGGHCLLDHLTSTSRTIGRWGGGRGGWRGVMGKGIVIDLEEKNVHNNLKYHNDKPNVQDVAFTNTRLDGNISNINYWLQFFFLEKALAKKVNNKSMF